MLVVLTGLPAFLFANNRARVFERSIRNFRARKRAPWVASGEIQLAAAEAPAACPCRPCAKQTGYLPGKAEVFGRTPALAQTATALPGKGSVLAARSAPPLPPRAGVPASNPASLVTSADSAPNLWPDRQSTPADCVGESAKPQVR